VGDSTQRQLLIGLVSRSTTANGHALSKVRHSQQTIYSASCAGALYLIALSSRQSARQPSTCHSRSDAGTDARFINSSGRHYASKTTVVSDTVHDGASCSTTPDCVAEQYDRLYITDLHYQSNKHDQYCVTTRPVSSGNPSTSE
jgi:hypothetical protein